MNGRKKRPFFVLPNISFLSCRAPIFVVLSPHFLSCRAPIFVLPSPHFCPAERPFLSCRAIARHPSLRLERHPQGGDPSLRSGRQKRAQGDSLPPCLPEVRFPFCPPEARKRRGTPRLTPQGDKKGG
jgi:hypothetical protein